MTTNISATTKKTIYGLYLPSHKSEFLDSSHPDYAELPDYLVEYRRYRLYDNAHDQLEAYVNTMCSASQMFTCQEDELMDTIKKLDTNFLDEKWLQENIYPFV